MSDADIVSEIFYGLFESEEALVPKTPRSRLDNGADIVDERKLPSLV
jgi:hypothetical protein